MFGFTGLTHHYPTYAPNSDVTTVTLENCWCENIRGEGGVSTACYGADVKALKMTIMGCHFVIGSRTIDSPIRVHLINDGCTLNIEGCTFSDDRGVSVPAISVVVNANNVTISDTTFSGFSKNVGTAPAVPVSAPEYIDGTLGNTGTENAHNVVKGDFSSLDVLYVGIKAYYGNLNVHANYGGTSDGGFPMADWPKRMDEIGLDFAAGERPQTDERLIPSRMGQREIL